jgi:predicted SnoaL-like aldol condensation-catalyzing enzyme
MKHIISTPVLRSALLACLLVGCATDDDAPPEPEPEPAVDQVALNRDLLHRYHVEVWEEGRLDRAGEYLGQGFTSHARPTTLPPGAQVGPDFLAQFWIGFPDLHSRADALLADGDLVTVRWTITGTHTGPFFGVAATGKPIEVSGMDILRVADGKFVEHWGGVADQMDDFLQQIDAPTQ